MVKKLMAVKGVQAAIAMTSEGASNSPTHQCQGFKVTYCVGIVIRSTMEQASAVHYAAMYAPLVHESRMAVTELGGTNLRTIRLRTTKHEVIIIPGETVCFTRVTVVDKKLGS